MNAHADEKTERTGTDKKKAAISNIVQKWQIAQSTGLYDARRTRLVNQLLSSLSEASARLDDSGHVVVDPAAQWDFEKDQALLSDEEVDFTKPQFAEILSQVGDKRKRRRALPAAAAAPDEDDDSDLDAAMLKYFKSEVDKHERVDVCSHQECVCRFTRRELGDEMILLDGDCPACSHPRSAHC